VGPESDLGVGTAGLYCLAASIPRVRLSRADGRRRMARSRMSMPGGKGVGTVYVDGNDGEQWVIGVSGNLRITVAAHYLGLRLVESGSQFSEKP